MAVLFVPILIMGLVLYFKSPQLLQKRLNNKEKQKTQKGVVAFSGIVFLIGFIMASLDFRFGISKVNNIVQIIAILVFLLSYVMYAEVMRENEYLSRTIEVTNNQKVIDTGLYGIIRHPMYTATIFMFLSVPMILGSYLSFAVFLIYPVLIVIRVLDEEKFLSKELAGYCEYKEKVKYRLIPFLW